MHLEIILVVHSIFSSKLNLIYFLSDSPFEEGSPKFLRDFQDCEVVAGSEIKLTCKFEGAPQPDVEWFKDGGPLEESDRVTCTVNDNVTSLVIKSAEADDEGWYRCRILNERGASAVEAELIVVEVPKFVEPMENVEMDEGIILIGLCTFYCAKS